MNRRFFGGLSGSVTGIKDGLLGLLRGVPKLTPRQERCIAEMEKDYEKLFGNRSGLPDRLKNLKTEMRGDGHH